MSFRNKFHFLVAILLLMVGCSTKEIPAAETLENAEPNSEIVAESQAIIEEVQNDEPIEESTLPAAPRDLVLNAADGTQLEGRFYPSKNSSAPLIMLYHWAPGDQDDWRVIASWLQNRGLVDDTVVETESIPWLDISWFPVIPESESFNVFTYTFRNCKGGCSSFEREKWYEDVKGAVDFAVGIEGIDTKKIIMIGTSIGSDGAVDGCAYLHQISPGSCLGAFSISPGNYLTIDFAEKVQELGTIPVWCLYAETDVESAQICKDLDLENFSQFSYPASMTYANGHGMNLIEKNQDPNPLSLMIRFIEELS